MSKRAVKVTFIVIYCLVVVMFILALTVGVYPTIWDWEPGAR